MKPIGVKSSTYIDFKTEHNKKYPKLEVGDHVRTSICKTFLPKVGHTKFV